MSNHPSNRSSGFWGGLLMGAVAGAVAGILAAPKTGRETRKILRKSAKALPELAEDLATSVQIQADRLSETAVQNWDGTLARLKEAIAAGIEAGVAENQRLNRGSAETVTRPARKSAPGVTDSGALEKVMGDRSLSDRSVGDRPMNDR